MAFFAVAVPIVIVAVAWSISAWPFRSIWPYFSQAQQAVQASDGTTPDEQRQSWTSALYYLIKRRSYQSTEDSQCCAARFRPPSISWMPQTAGLPACHGECFDENASIERIVAVGNDLYLLNVTDGVVSRQFSPTRAPGRSYV
jgi:hypothetical protein